MVNAFQERTYWSLILRTFSPKRWPTGFCHVNDEQAPFPMCCSVFLFVYLFVSLFFNTTATINDTSYAMLGETKKKAPIFVLCSLTP